VRLDVLGDVGIEQQDRHAPDIRAPDPRDDGPLRERTGDEHVLTLRIARRAQRRVLRVDMDVLRDLLAVAVYALIEVPLPVEQAYRDERQAHVARRLAVI